MFKFVRHGQRSLLRSYSSSRRDAFFKTALVASTAFLATSTVVSSGIHSDDSDEKTSSSYMCLHEHIRMNTTFCQDAEEERNFEQTLKHHRNQLEYYRERWNWHNAGSRLPTVSWPTNIPDEPIYKSLVTDFQFCQRHQQKHKSDDATGLNSTRDSKYCRDIQFRIASYMLLQQDLETQKKGLASIQILAESDHPDGMCAYATCLNDGRAGLDINPDAAVSWWKNACAQYNHIQSCYEMGVAYYTGEGLPEDEVQAVNYFRRAADCGHAGAAYMLGDCLLDGIGVERDRGEALEWLVISAELGHRGARSRVLAVLELEEGKSYGKFTDASRQTLVQQVEATNEYKHDDATKSFEKGKTRDGLERQYSRRPVTLERRYTIGGGARNPAVLGRRKTIVAESRHDH